MEKLGAMDMQNSRQSLQRSRIASPVQACTQSPKPTITPARTIEAKLRSRREEKQEDVSSSGLTESRVIADVDTFEGVSTPPETPAKAPLVLGNVRVVPPVRAQQLSSPSLKSTCLQTLSSTTTSTTHSLGTVGASDVGSLAHEHVSLNSARCEPGEQEQAALALKLAVFDFDCTLSVLHIFGSLSGSVPTSSPVPAPHARTEIGQLVRLQALDMDPLWGPGVFALKAFGGVRRVEQLRSFLGELRRHGLECVVCSCGMVGTMRKCLDQVGLLQFFSKTFGHVSDSLGATEYDLRVSAAAVGRNACFLGTAAMAMPATKNEVIADYISDLNLDSEQVLLIDDSISDVWKAQGLCRTLFVRHGRGMGESEFQTVKDMLTSKASS
jgi:phosphoglycolate phosphatase-like HAD superfamily hydrolase